LPVGTRAQTTKTGKTKGTLDRGGNPCGKRAPQVEKPRTPGGTGEEEGGPMGKSPPTKDGGGGIDKPFIESKKEQPTRG